MNNHLLGFVAATVLLAGCAPSPEPQAAPTITPASTARTATVPTATTNSELRYPVILPDVESQLALGVVEGNYGPGGPALANLCYYYGDGGSDLSLSDEFVELYRARGFSLRTLCLGMVSGITANPETGERLATVQAVNLDEALHPAYNGEPGPVGPVTTIGLPDCFARGLPLTDCKFRFDPLSGRELDAAEREKIKTRGQKILEIGRALLASGSYAEACPGGEALHTYYDDESGKLQERTEAEVQACYVERTGPNDYPPDYLAREFYINLYHPEMVPYGGFVDVSPVFAEGFAYALFADGAAGPSFGFDNKALVVDSKTRSSQAVLESLKLKAKGG